MHSYPEADQIKSLVDAAKRIVIMQADNPDADSLGSALALEQILGDLGKEPLLYCGVDMPGYLKYLKGWDRVSSDVPSQFDLSVIVDASTMTLFERLAKSGQQGWVSAKPCVVLDHHTSVMNEIPFVTVTIKDDQRSSTGELMYALAKSLDWPMSVPAQEFLMTAILGDTQGLSNSLARTETYHILGDMVAAGVDRPKLEELRRDFNKMPAVIFTYKAELIQRTAFYADGKLALVTVPQSEINEYSPLYNPAPLIQTDMLQTEGVGIAVVLKHYDDGHVTAAIRCNSLFPIGATLAEHFGGGGHPFAAGFKVQDGRSIDGIKNEVVRKTTELLATLEQS